MPASSASASSANTPTITRRRLMARLTRCFRCWTSSMITATADKNCMEPSGIPMERGLTVKNATVRNGGNMDHWRFYRPSGTRSLSKEYEQ